MRELNVILNQAADMAHNISTGLNPSDTELLAYLWEFTEKMVEEAGGIVQLNQWSKQPLNQLTMVAQMGRIGKVLVIATVEDRIQFKLESIIS